MTEPLLPAAPAPGEPASPAAAAAPSFSRRLGGPDRRRIVAVLVACLAVVASAAVTVGASPEPSSSGDPAAAASTAPSTAPDPSAEPEASTGPKTTDPNATDPWPFKGAEPFGGAWRLGIGRGGPDGVPGIVRRGGVEITAIDGSDLSLETVDGWTRTITVTDETEITKGGDAIELEDLKVGDRIHFRQQRADDGTFTITHVAVVQPHVAGTVTATTDSTITVEQPDGTSVTVHVDASTSFRVQGVSGAADLDDVEVGMLVVATGEQNDNGSLDASRVLAGTERPFRHHWKNDRGDQPAPDSSDAPG